MWASNLCHFNVTGQICTGSISSAQSAVAHSYMGPLAQCVKPKIVAAAPRAGFVATLACSNIGIGSVSMLMRVNDTV